MIGFLLLSAASLPIPASELKQLAVENATMPRMIFMCRSEDDSVGAIVDLRNDNQANYLSIHETGKSDQEFRAPIRHAAERILPDAYARELSTDTQSDGSRMEFQLQRRIGQLIEAWFRWSRAKVLIGTCRNVPAPPDKAERG